MYFLTYEYLKKDMQVRFGTEGGKALMGTIIAGGMAGIANWAIGMPADVLKSRLQTGKKMSVFDIPRFDSLIILFSSRWNL